jgi:hypothetical protein
MGIMTESESFHEDRRTRKMSGVPGLPDARGNTFGAFHEAHKQLTRPAFLQRFTAPFLLAPVTVDRATWGGAVVLSLQKRTQGPSAQINVGRDPATNDVAVIHPSVSKRHAMFFQEDLRWYVMDVGSSNGTLLDEEELEPQEKAWITRDLVLIEFGDVRLTFTSPGAVYDLFEAIKRRDASQRLARQTPQARPRPEAPELEKDDDAPPSWMTAPAPPPKTS